MFGDGATSEGDFHEAMNFAGAFGVGCVFLCQNNGWAISLATSKQTAAERIADKAAGYGMPGVQVDGNDVFAVYAATKTAVDRARAGEGPSLIEAMTYRMGPHSSADDPGRYRSAELTESWRRRDPIDRLRTYLETRGCGDRSSSRRPSAMPRTGSSVPSRRPRRCPGSPPPRSSTRCTPS